MRLLLALILSVCLLPAAQAADTPPVGSTVMRITLATPGSGNLEYLPADLITKIGADRAEGVELVVHNFAGGPLALKDMVAGNSDFAFAGLPAHANLRASGLPITSLGVLNQTATFVLMVRSDLKLQIKTPADLKGRLIGVNTSSRTGKSTSQPLAEFALRRAGVDPDLANYLPAGQNYAEQSAALTSHSVDALMGDEPFASRLKRDGTVYFLLDMHAPKVTRATFGGLFIHAALAGETTRVKNEPEKVRRMVAVLNRTLGWIHSHSPAQIVAALGLVEPERGAMLDALKRDQASFPERAAFSRDALRVTEEFVHNGAASGSPAATIRFEEFVDSRWAHQIP
jgi:NitT/TauT family transport system substrate-binding protein